MVQGEMAMPREIVAVDWGATPAKRQLCRAVLRGGRYEVQKPVPVVDPATLELPPRSLIAFDCVIGLPDAYTEVAHLPNFREGLELFGSGDFARFWEPATTPEEISPGRPFYPARGTGAKREHLERALGQAAFELRDCDRATGGGPLFWLVGAKQVGRSSIAVWRDVLQPRRHELALWPFDGKLQDLLSRGRPVVAEMYPAHLARSLGLEVNKRDPDSRRMAGEQLLAQRWQGIDPFLVRDLLRDGFGPGPQGEDAFDATISCLALCRLLLAGEIPEPPDHVRAAQGWILGL